MRAHPYSRRALLQNAGSIAVLAALDGCGGGATDHIPRERTIGLGFESVVGTANRLPQLAQQFDRVHATGAGISVGRTDWTAFPWHDGGSGPGPPGRHTRRDYVANAMTVLGAGSGGSRRMTAVVDALVSGWIAADPAIAGVAADGKRSTSMASLTALTRGPVGDRLIAFVAAVSERYRPYAISLTELFLDTYTFGADDLASYRTATGAADWPRTNAGGIDTADPRIAAWRADAVTSVVRRARDAAHRYGVKLTMEVRAAWPGSHTDPRQSGQDYTSLLKVADRLMVWDYFGLNDQPATYTKKLAHSMSTRGAHRFITSVGLWTAHGTISAGELATASRASVSGGIDSVWVTPATLMTSSHWSALRRAWA